MKLAEIAQKLGCRIEGNANWKSPASLAWKTRRPGQLTFSFESKYRALVETTARRHPARGRRRPPASPARPPLAVLALGEYLFSFAHAIALFLSAAQYSPGIHPTAAVASSARIGTGAHIGPYCFVDEDVHIGENAVLHSFVSLYRGVRIGSDFFAHAHAVVREFCAIGDRVILAKRRRHWRRWFRLRRQAGGRWYKILQSGPVVIEDDVEVQSNSCVDRATIGETRIRRGAKIDDLVLVGHASKIGEDSSCAAQVGLPAQPKWATSAFLRASGRHRHLTIGDGAVVTAQSGVPATFPQNPSCPASPGSRTSSGLRTLQRLNRLPDLQRTVRELRPRLFAARAHRRACRLAHRGQSRDFRFPRPLPENCVSLFSRGFPAGAGRGQRLGHFSVHALAERVALLHRVLGSIRAAEPHQDLAAAQAQLALAHYKMRFPNKPRGQPEPPP